jgi:hypothetical protein
MNIHECSNYETYKPVEDELTSTTSTTERSAALNSQGKEEKSKIEDGRVNKIATKRFSVDDRSKTPGPEKISKGLNDKKRPDKSVTTQKTNKSVLPTVNEDIKSGPATSRNPIRKSNTLHKSQDMTMDPPKSTRRPTVGHIEEKKEDDSFDEKQFSTYRPPGTKKIGPPSQGKKLSLAEKNLNHTTNFEKLTPNTTANKFKKDSILGAKHTKKSSIADTSLLNKTAISMSKKPETGKLNESKSNEEMTKTADSTKEKELDTIINNVKMPEKKEIVLPPRKQFTNKTIEALTIAAGSDILSADTRMILAFLNKEVRKGTDIEGVLKAKLEVIKAILKSKKKELYNQVTEDDIEALVSRQFTPSKTASNGLNFVNKEEESNLCKKEQQPEEVINIFKLLYIFLGVDYEGLDNNNIVENFIQTVLPSKGIEGISKYNINFRAIVFTEVSKVKQYRRGYL